MKEKDCFLHNYCALCCQKLQKRTKSKKKQTPLVKISIICIKKMLLPVNYSVVEMYCFDCKQIAYALYTLLQAFATTRSSCS